jgi:hypothetical protein
MACNNKRYIKIGGGDTGYVYSIIRDDDPIGELGTRVFKYPSSKREVRMALEWAARNHNKEDNYSAGPVNVLYFKVWTDKEGNELFEFMEEASDDSSFGLEMANLGDVTYDDCNHRLTKGELVLMYLMLMNCIPRLIGIKIMDTGHDNCMCQGIEQDFKIYLVDTHEWKPRSYRPCIIHNFTEISLDFRMCLIEALQPINEFLWTKFTDELTFLDAMVKSCEELSEKFLSDPHAMEQSIHYHERIDKLLTSIKADVEKAKVQLQAFESLKAWDR